MMRLAAVAALIVLGACTTPGPVATITAVRFPEVEFPQGVSRANGDLAEDFLELTFGLESGEPLDGLLRYETPVRVYMSSPALAPYRPDLRSLLARLRREAGIDIAETRDPEAAQIFIEAVPAAQINRVFPNAACFIVPGETSWRGFMRRGGGPRLRWSEQETLGGAAIFLPLDTTPQDVRDCLNEEITQALGPANDLYRLPDSIWNDDNFHGAATSFDMLMLRALYQPELRSGMSRDQVAGALSGVLARENPSGRGRTHHRRHPESPAWSSTIEVALSRDGDRSRRLEAAQSATQIAREMQPVDHRLGVSLLTLGRLNLRRDPTLSADNFAEAYALFSRQYGPADVRTAQAGVHLAALALGTGQYDTAIQLADVHVPAAISGQNAILIAGFLSIKAEALSRKGAVAEAGAVRLDSLRWARYGFGDDDGRLAREQAQLAALLRLEEG